MSAEDLKAKKAAEEAVERAKEVVDKEKRESAIAEAAEFEKHLESVERTTGSSGAIPLTPKAQLLSVGDLVEENPDKHYRFVNVGSSEKAELRKASGYERVPAAEGGKQVGNMALFAIPRREYEKRVDAIKEANKERLSVARNDMERAAESIARELRDRHGINVDAERILIRE